MKSNDYRVWLFGDSVIDNSYWNGVDKDTTAEQLKNLLPGVKVIDRSTEELDAQSMISYLERNQTINVRDHYVMRRRNLGVPYDPPDGRIQPNP